MFTGSFLCPWYCVGQDQLLGCAVCAFGSALWLEGPWAQFNALTVAILSFSIIFEPGTPIFIWYWTLHWGYDVEQSQTQSLPFWSLWCRGRDKHEPKDDMNQCRSKSVSCTMRGRSVMPGNIILQLCGFTDYVQNRDGSNYSRKGLSSCYQKWVCCGRPVQASGRRGQVPLKVY